MKGLLRDFWARLAFPYKGPVHLDDPPRIGWPPRRGDLVVAIYRRGTCPPEGWEIEQVDDVSAMYWRVSNGDGQDYPDGAVAVTCYRRVRLSPLSRTKGS